MLAMVTDITEKKQAEARRARLEAQLLESQKMEAIGTLAGGIAHDFNNILAAILGNVALAQQHAHDDAPVRASLEQIRIAAARARSLVQQIIAFSRRQPQALVMQPLRQLVEEAILLLRSTLPALVELDVRLAAAPLLVRADATQLQQVVMNLCTNAWHALRGSSGRITVGLAAVTLDPDAARRAGGVPAACRPGATPSSGSATTAAAWTRRRARASSSPSSSPSRSARARAWASRSCMASSPPTGAITVRSSLGHGSTFEVCLPLAEPQALSPAESPLAVVAAPRGRGEHVLYVGLHHRRDAHRRGATRRAQPAT